MQRPESLPRWRPVLTGPDREAALTAARGIARALKPTIGTPARNPCLFAGRAGVALFFAYASLADVVPDAEGLAWQALEDAERALTRQRTGATLCGGLAGIAWTHNHLHRHLAGESDDGSLDEIDAALAPVAGDPESPTELLYGLTGIGVYALSRLAHPSARRLARQVVHGIAEQAVSQDGRAWWVEPPSLGLSKTPRVNLGVAHGVPGMIGFLARAAEAGIARRVALPLLRRASRWLLTRPGEPDSGRGYGAWSSENGVADEPARLAWCYGDPGIAGSLLAAARATGDRRLQRAAVAIGLRALHHPPVRHGVVDASLCHGAGGLGLIYQRCYQLTGHPDFKTAARGWYRAALGYRRPGQGIGGFSAAYESREPKSRGRVIQLKNAGFLMGSAGVGLALLAAATPVEPAWDQLLLLSSGRPVSGLRAGVRMVG